jgi:cytoskeletal protein RodZ
MSSPSPGSTLTAASTTFSWNAGAGGVTGYYVWVGTSPGGNNLAQIGLLSGTSTTVTLPINGATIYVRLWTVINGTTYLYNDYTYTEFTQSAATMSSPSPGGTLTAASTTFSWNAGAGGVTGYYVWVGTSLGSNNLAQIGLLSGTSTTVNLPINGATIYVRLWTVINGTTYLYNDYTYTEFTQSAATMSSPSNGSTLTSASTTFTWNAGSGGVTGYYVWIGTSLGGNNLAQIGLLSGTSTTVTLPINGAAIYVRLWTVINGTTYLYNDYTYTEFTQSAATMSSPSPSSTLTAASTTFSWNAGSGGVTGYYVWVGTSLGGNNLAQIGLLSGTSTTVNLPINGAAIYVRLWTVINGTTYLYNDYTYTEFTQSAATMSSPSPNSTLTSASTTFTWNAGSGGVTGYYVWVGTSLGGNNLAQIGLLSGTSTTVNLPINGAAIYVRLWTVINGTTYLYNDYTYTEFTQSAATMSSPSPNSTLTSASTTFSWNAGAGGVTGYYVWVGTSLGTNNVLQAGPLSGTSTTVNLPTNGATIYVRLWTVINGTTYLYNDYTYTEAP